MFNFLGQWIVSKQELTAKFVPTAQIPTDFVSWQDLDLILGINGSSLAALISSTKITVDSKMNEAKNAMTIAATTKSNAQETYRNTVKRAKIELDDVVETQNAIYSEAETDLHKLEIVAAKLA